MSIRSAVAQAAWEVEALARRLRIEHDVWTQGCDELLRRLQVRSRT